MIEYITLPRQAKNIAGQRFGRLVVLGPVAVTWDKRVVWQCNCDCGRTVSTRAGDLIAGKSRSCGCVSRERIATDSRTHGMTKKPIYAIWCSMKDRCSNPKCKAYPNYGERGIKVCDEWRDSFEHFYLYVAQLAHYGESGYSLDRVDNDGDYEPGNVRWVERTEQNRNTRNTINIAHNGKTMCISAWANELKISQFTLYNRLRAGWSIERALTEPIRIWPSQGQSK